MKALTRGLSDIADVEPWTTTFNPGTSTLSRLHRADPRGRLHRLHRPGQLDVAAGSDAIGQASPRDNVVFEAGLFGSMLGMGRTFILHANGAKLPGATCSG